LMSSKGVLVRFLRAQMSLCAQFASMASLSASLSAPRIRKGPTWVRGNGASSSCTGNGGGVRLTASLLLPRLGFDSAIRDPRHHGSRVRIRDTQRAPRKRLSEHGATRPTRRYPAGAEPRAERIHQA